MADSGPTEEEEQSAFREFIKRVRKWSEAEYIEEEYDLDAQLRKLAQIKQ